MEHAWSSIYVSYLYNISTWFYQIQLPYTIPSVNIGRTKLLLYTETFRFEIKTFTFLAFGWHPCPERHTKVPWSLDQWIHQPRLTRLKRLGYYQPKNSVGRNYGPNFFFFFFKRRTWDGRSEFQFSSPDFFLHLDVLDNCILYFWF